MTGIRDQGSEPSGAANSPLRRHCGILTHSLSAARGLPLRSHNSLLYDCPSTKCPGLPITRMQAKACSGASCRVPVAPGAIAFRGLPKWIWRKPLSARTAGAAAHQSAERIGGGDRNRTDDPLLAKQVLSQLSYTPGATLVAPPASGVSQKRRKQTAATAPPPLSQFASQTTVGVTLSFGKRRGGPGRI